MLYVTRDEQIYTGKQTIDLKNVVRIDFHNRGSSDAFLGLMKIKASERFVYETGGNITISGKIDLKFENNAEGELYADIKTFAGCNNK